MDLHKVVLDANDALRARHKYVHLYLATLLGVPMSTMNRLDEEESAPFTLRRGTLIASGSSGREPTNARTDDFTIRLGMSDCALCQRSSWRRTHVIHDQIVAAAQHLERHPSGRVVVVSGRECGPCAEVCVVLLSAYLAIRARTSAHVSSAAPTGPLAPDVVLGVMRRLGADDRRAAAATCKTWYGVAADSALADASVDAVRVLRLRFAQLENRPWTRFPIGDDLIVVWALTNHWLEQRQHQ
jgi:hypothetical protein